MELTDFFKDYPKVAIAFSGGVDSAYLVYAASKYAKEMQAYYVKTAFQPEFELADAERLAEELGLKMRVIPLDILTEEGIISNPKDRCYYCKRQIFGNIISQAKEDGFNILLDGTNASDDAGDRPGMKALSELEVLSPLRMCGITKGEVRRLSREAGLFTWDKLAYACLATRIVTGQRIDEESLVRTEKAENYLFQLGFRDFRVRTVGEMAKIQVTNNDINLLVDNREKILEQLGKMYKSVCLDLEVRSEH